MKKLTLEVLIMEDGTLVIKDLAKEYFDDIGRVIIDNNDQFGLPVCKTFYQEQEEE